MTVGSGTYRRADAGVAEVLAVDRELLEGGVGRRRGGGSEGDDGGLHLVGIIRGSGVLRRTSEAHRVASDGVVGSPSSYYTSTLPLPSSGKTSLLPLGAGINLGISDLPR